MTMPLISRIPVRASTYSEIYLQRNDRAKRRSQAKSTRACWWLRNSSSSTDVDGAQANCRFRYVILLHFIYKLNLMPRCCILVPSMSIRLVKLQLPVHDQLALTSADPLLSWIIMRICTIKYSDVCRLCVCSEQANDLPPDRSVERGRL